MEETFYDDGGLDAPFAIAGVNPSVDRACPLWVPRPDGTYLAVTKTEAYGPRRGPGGKTLEGWAKMGDGEKRDVLGMIGAYLAQFPPADMEARMYHEDVVREMQLARYRETAASFAADLDGPGL